MGIGEQERYLDFSYYFSTGNVDTKIQEVKRPKSKKLIFN